ncbi:hypothetical protein pb186bvf_009084 [Paramecium bursaria]
MIFLFINNQISFITQKMGVCGSKKQKEMKFIAEIKEPNTQQASLQKIKAQNQDVLIEVGEQKQSISVFHDNPYTLYTQIQKAPSQSSLFKFQLVQHILSGQSRLMIIIDKSNDLSQDFYQQCLKHSLQHPNISHIHEYYDHENSFFIICDYCQGGSLWNWLQKKQQLAENQVARIFQQIVASIQYLHTLGLTHGKLTLKSFSFVNESDSLPIKFTDYENLFGQTEIDLCDQMYMSPETATNQELEASQSSDIWACGVMLYRMLSDSFPFEEQKTIQRAVQQVKRGVINYDLMELEKRSKKGLKLLQSLLIADPQKRIPLQQCMRDEWFEVCLEFQRENLDYAFSHLTQRQKHVNRVQRKLLIAMIKEFGNEKQQQIFEIFNQFDINKDGKLNRQELVQIYKQLHPNIDVEGQVNLIMKYLDQDKSGDIDFDEFIIAYIDKPSLVNKQNIETLFRMYDREKSGKLSCKRMSELTDIQEIKIDKILNHFLKKLAEKKNQKYDKQEYFNLDEFHYRFLFQKVQSSSIIQNIEYILRKKLGHIVPI